MFEGKRSGWRMECGGFSVTLSQREQKAFFGWLKETGRLGRIQEALEGKSEKAQSLMCAAYMEWRAMSR